MGSNLSKIGQGSTSGNKLLRKTVGSANVHREKIFHKIKTYEVICSLIKCWYLKTKKEMKKKSEKN